MNITLESQQSMAHVVSSLAGVVLCLLFAMWFASGAVLHFVGFPALSNHDRHRGSADLSF